MMGFLMLGCVAALMLLTGLPAFLAMIGVSSAFAAIGVATGVIPLNLLGALPARVLGLLESDLLQALPLYVLMGTLLNRLPLAGAVFRALSPLGPRRAGLVLGLLVAPMNGSAGASVSLLSRIMAPRLRAAGIGEAPALATVCAAGTLGMVIPPSLVLILFGDAMMRAHTEALNSTNAMTRIINTQDIFLGALVPGLLIFALCTFLAKGRGMVGEGNAQDRWLAALTIGAVLTLLGGVTLGYLYAVEAAATGAVILTLIGAVHLPAPIWRELLQDTMTTTGALFALFLAAVTFTLVFRAFGSDRILADWVMVSPGGATGALILVLVLLAGCALVLDAFEIVFVIVPLVMPPLLMRAPDAVWVSVLALLVLQISFLIPPFGYAMMIGRGLWPVRLTLGAVARAVAPYVAVQFLVLGLVALWPNLVHLTAPADTTLRPSLTDAEAKRRMLQMTMPDDN